MRSKFLLWVFATLAMSTIALGQANYAGLRGSISDQQHHVIAGASLELTAMNTGAKRKVTSNENGLYAITGLLPGEYNLQVAHTGFTTSQQNLQLEVGQEMTVDVGLDVGHAQQTVTVKNSAETLKTSDASVGEVVDKRSVQQLPLNGRMLVDLMLTVPGSHVSMGAQDGSTSPLYWRPGQRSAVSIGGTRPNANYFLLDGATNTDPTFNTQNLSASPDAVQEFQIEIGSYSADMGGAGGGQVNIITRSGSSNLHGTAYEYLRNGAFDAHSFNQMGGSNHLVQNNYGAALGGPVFGDRKHTFFFINYEAMRHVEAMSMTDTVPTDQEVAGDFSASNLNIYDPATTVKNPNYDPSLPVSPTNPQFTRQQFAYNGQPNVIPPNRLNFAASLMLQKYVPRPNTMGMMGGMTMMGQPTVIGAGNDANNYLDTRNEVMDTDQGTLRLDHDFTRGDTAFVRYSAGGEHGFMPENLPGFGYNHDNLSQQGVLGWTHIFNLQLLDITTLAISRLAMAHLTQSANKNDIVDELGIEGANWGGPNAWGAPYFTVQGYSAFGDSWLATPMKAWSTIIEGRNALNWQRGRHSLKIGGGYEWFIWPMWALVQSRGYYQFTNGFTTDIGANDGTGSGLASFLLGLPVARQLQANGVPQMNLRQWYANGYVQDTWRIMPNTTLDFGLRYEYMSALTDVKYTNSNLTFSSDGVPSVFIGGQNGFPDGLAYPGRKNFAPRLGIDESVPNLGIVFHLAYGIFYTPVDMNTWCNQRHNIPKIFPETAQSDAFTPSINGFNWGPPVLGTTTVSFTAMPLHPPSQYIQQWSASLEKSLGKETTLEIGYLGSGGFHLQRAHLINNAQPGPGAIGPRRPFPTMSFVPNSVIPSNVTVVSTTFPASTINYLENSAQSWYDGGYVNVRRRYSSGLSFLANYTFAKSLTNAPDFRSPMFESAIPQNDDDLAAEKGPACDIRQRVSLSTVYDIPGWSRNRFIQLATQHWRASTIFQVQTGFPLTISVFGDTANAGTAVGENPIRANYTGQPVFGHGTRNAETWFNPGAFVAPRAYTFGDVGRNSVYGPGMETTDIGLTRVFNFGERIKFEGRGDFFNAFNHTNLDTPDRFVNDAGFGSITGVTTPGREIQLSARLSF